MAKNKLKNRVIVESSDGDRAFLLLEGDIFIEKADVYIFNSYLSEGGSLLKTLKEKYNQEEIPETPFYFSTDGREIGKIQLDDGRIILMLHSELVEHAPITVEMYHSIMKMVFASLSALEAMGEVFDTVAFPVLLRNGLADIYPQAVKVLIEKATEWLKASEHTRTIKYVLYKSGDADIWNTHLDEVLGRRVIEIDEFSDLHQYKNKALSMLEQMDKRAAYWEDTLLPIQNALRRRDFRPEVVAAFSRKLLEVYCHERGKADENYGESLDAYLNYMRENKLMNAWDMQTLYQIRSFGNPSIHRPDMIIGPKIMSEQDVTILLICLCRLLELHHEFVSMIHENRG